MTSPAQAPETARLRLSIVGVIVISLFAALFARLWYLQVMDSKVLASKVVQNATRTVLEPAPRGRILDRNGKVLVQNRYSFVVTLSRVAAEKNPAVIDRLAALFNQPADEVRKRVSDPRFSPYRPVPLFEDVPIEKVIYVKEHTEDFPPDQVGADRQAERMYPQGNLAAHVLGYVGEINDEELKQRKGEAYVQGDEIGKSGVEQTYENLLRGKARKTVVEVDPRGRVLRNVTEELPVQGKDVYLTIDADVQRVAEESLAQGLQAARNSFDNGGNGKHFVAPAGAVVVLDPQDGSVLALASYPTYDPTQFVNGISAANFSALQDPGNGNPLTDRAISGLYPPGSTFKLATATAALAKGVVDATTTFPDNGTYVIPNCKGRCSFTNANRAKYGRVPMARALTVSSDVYFYNLGAQFWFQRAKVGEAAIQDVARQFGLGIRTGVPLAGEAVGRISDPKTRARLNDKNPKAFPEGKWFVGDNVVMSIGQGETVVTPIQLATAYATFGNGGTVWQPKLGLKVTERTAVEGEERVVQQFPSQQAGRIDLPAAVRDPILAGLRGAVADEKGTAKGAFTGYAYDLLPVAGKTGTAQVTGKQDTALFAAFAPVDKPRYAISVVMEESGFGGAAAAPVARRIFDQLAGRAPGEITLGTGRD